MPDIESKALFMEIKLDDDEPGSVTAQFATFDEVDREGDITKRGAFGEQDVLLGAYGHTSFGRFGPAVPPIGRGTIIEEGKHAVFKGRFNLEMVSGREMYESVKMSAKLQEWSYGFKVMRESTVVRDGVPRRVLELLKVAEVSPVMIGAGQHTQTTGLKEASEMTLLEHSDVALAAWSGYLDRLKALARLRADEGRTLSEEHRQRLRALKQSIGEIDAELLQLLDVPDRTAELAAFVAYQKSLARRHGVPIGV